MRYDNSGWSAAAEDPAHVPRGREHGLHGDQHPVDPYDSVDDAISSAAIARLVHLKLPELLIDIRNFFTAAEIKQLSHMGYVKVPTKYATLKHLLIFKDCESVVSKGRQKKDWIAAHPVEVLADLGNTRYMELLNKLLSSLAGSAPDSAEETTYRTLQMTMQQSGMGKKTCDLVEVAMALLRRDIDPKLGEYSARAYPLCLRAWRDMAIVNDMTKARELTLAMDTYAHTALQVRLDVAQDVDRLLEGFQDNAAAARGSTHDTLTQGVAQDIMTMLYIKDNIVRDLEEVAALLEEPMKRRRDYVNNVASNRGVTQPTTTHDPDDRGVVYTPAEWIHWYEHNPLTEDDFTTCLEQWKGDMKLHGERTLAKIAKAQASGSRLHKKVAREARRGAFRSELRNTCLNYQLALCFLQHPPGSMHTLLERWSECMKSPEYQAENKTARKVNTEDSEAVIQEAARNAKKRFVEQGILKNTLNICAWSTWTVDAYTTR